MNPEKRFYLRIDGVDDDDLGDRVHYLANRVFSSIVKAGHFEELHGVVPVRNAAYDPRLPGPGEVTVDADALGIVLDLADARLDDDLATIRSGGDAESIGYSSYTTRDANDAINELETALREQGDA